tara:strand:+ start:36982 stop:40743 length:3762 start_codon:yes stop_codon:yes gene_type:complete
MNRFGPVVVGLIFLMLVAPFTSMVSQQTAELSTAEVNFAEGWNVDQDVPTWRIGDEWVYETKFDVAQLIAQANVSASLNTLTGDTTYTVEDIFFITVDGTQTLAYKLKLDGSFTSGGSGATLEGVTGRLDIGYTGEDIVRVRDLAVINSEFELDVSFAPFNLGFLSQNIAVISFDTSYSPPKEKIDFPVHTGDQWYMPFFASTGVTGSSDYFDPSEFDTAGPENNSWQITANGVPTDGTSNIGYTGCDDSYKINEWNETGVSQGYNWYCPAVRYNSWMRVSNAAGFTIDWLLKSYSPADSWGVQATSNPGARNVEVNVDLQFLATLPNSEQILTATYETSPGGQPQGNKNMQIRYESTNLLASPTTNGSGMLDYLLNVSNGIDMTPSSDDYSSNGVIVWDPVTEIIGATTVVIDLTVVAIDLVAQSDSIIVTRTRGTDVQTLNQAIGYGALPGDLLSFSIPAQNRGVLTSPPTEIEVITPDGTSIRESIPAIPSYSEQRIVVNWTVPAETAIGNQTLSFTVDPDQLVIEDANRSNNDASVDVFIGRAPTGFFTYDEGMYTFDNIVLNATASFDEDGGDVECRFEIETKPGLIDVIEAPDCITQWNWSDGGEWPVTVIVFDEELDEDIVQLNVSVLNRAPYMNLSMVESIDVETQVTIDASDSGDIDTISPSGQQVSITWPGLACQEGLTQPTCTITPMAEGPTIITAVATDDDGETTTVSSTLDVLNVAPTLESPELWYGGQILEVDSMGAWSLDEDQVALLRIVGDDTLSDRDDITIEWLPSDMDENWTVATKGPSSTATVSWPTAGLHQIQVSAFDDDGERSVVRTGMVNVNNLPPTISGLGSDVPIYEDDNITLSVAVSDTPSDIDSLTVCWDSDAQIDSNSDGNMLNDCEMQGVEMTTAWSTRGIRQITATVTDNDGAQAMTSVNVSVLNLPPSASITNSSNVFELMEGDNITLSGLTSRETAGDKLTLRYDWDSDLIDSNLDGDTTGEVDYSGPEYTITNLEPGTWTFTLTVTDDDGDFATSVITLTVAEKPAEGFLESVSAVLGGGTTAIVGGLAVIVIILAGFLLLTRKRSVSENEYSSFSNVPKNQPPLPDGQPSFASEPTLDMSAQTAGLSPDIYGQQAYAPPVQAAAPVQEAQPAYDPYAQQYAAPQQSFAASTPDALDALMAPEPTPQPVAAPVAAPAAVSGPPLPSTGLPQGWTMEQWQHYGEQYLAAQMGQTAPTQPTTTNTSTQSASTDMSGFLDDLDL